MRSERERNLELIPVSAFVVGGGYVSLRSLWVRGCQLIIMLSPGFRSEDISTCLTLRKYTLICIWESRPRRGRERKGESYYLVSFDRRFFNMGNSGWVSSGMRSGGLFSHLEIITLSAVHEK